MFSHICKWGNICRWGNFPYVPEFLSPNSEKMKDSPGRDG
jgi:hypothetical protein